MPTEEMDVLEQEDAKGTWYSCGFHALKNGLLGLLYQQGHINKDRMMTLAAPQDEASVASENSTEESVALPDPEAIRFYNALYDEITRVMFDGKEDLKRDLSIAQIKEGMLKLKAGLIDLSAYGITNNMLTSLDYSKMTAFNMPHGQQSDFGNDNIESALALAALARTDEDCKHVFAVGSPGVGHWANVFMEKTVEGEVKLSFVFTDSFGSVSMARATNGIEAIINKNEDELREYILNVYEADNYQFAKMYHRFFDLDGNVKLDGQYDDSILDDVTDFIDYEEFIRRNGENWAASIVQKFNVLAQGQLLDNPNDRTKDYMHQLVNVATVIEQVYAQECQVIKAGIADLDNNGKKAAIKKLAKLENIREELKVVDAALILSMFPNEQTDETQQERAKAVAMDVQLTNITAQLEKLNTSIGVSKKLITDLEANHERSDHQNNLLVKAKEGLVRKLDAKESLGARKAELLASKNQAFKQKIQDAVKHEKPNAKADDSQNDLSAALR